MLSQCSLAGGLGAGLAQSLPRVCPWASRMPSVAYSEWGAWPLLLDC